MPSRSNKDSSLGMLIFKAVVEVGRRGWKQDVSRELEGLDLGGKGMGQDFGVRFQI